MSDYVKMTHISVINMMRNKIGLPDLSLKFAIGKSEEELEGIRDKTIVHYNEALLNKL